MNNKGTDRLRVAWLYENLLWWNGGIRYLLEVSKRLVSSCDLEIYTTRASPGNKEKFSSSGVPIVEFSNTSVDNKRYWLFFPFYVLSNTCRLRKLLKNYDVIISTSPTTCLIAAMLNNKKIFVMYDVNFWLYSQEFLDSVHPLLKIAVKILMPLARIIDRWAVRRADSIVTICNYTANLMQAVYGRTPLVMHEGVDSDFFSNRHDPYIESMYSNHAVMLHLASYISPTRGTEYIIRALPRVISEIPNALLLVLNPSNEIAARSKLSALAENLGVHDNLRFLSAIGDRELPNYYSLARVLVQPSLDENTHLPVEEAAACQTPAVTFRGTLEAEDVINETTGLTVPRKDVTALAEAIIRLIKDPGLSEKLGKRAREHVKNNFSWDVNADALWSLIQSTANS